MVVKSFMLSARPFIAVKTLVFFQKENIAAATEQQSSLLLLIGRWAQEVQGKTKRWRSCRTLRAYVLPRMVVLRKDSIALRIKQNFIKIIIILSIKDQHLLKEHSLKVNDKRFLVHTQSGSST